MLRLFSIYLYCMYTTCGGMDVESLYKYIPEYLTSNGFPEDFRGSSEMEGSTSRVHVTSLTQE